MDIFSPIVKKLPSISLIRRQLDIQKGWYIEERQRCSECFNEVSVGYKQGRRKKEKENERQYVVARRNIYFLISADTFWTVSR